LKKIVRIKAMRKPVETSLIKSEVEPSCTMYQKIP
jgi:hypothetical protein